MKKIICLVLILIIVLSTIAYANIPAMGPCSSCGGTMSLEETIYDEWIVIRIQGTKSYCSREVYQLYRCDRCANADGLSYIEYKWINNSDL